ncbi:MAG: hypothetical protein JST50_15285 [Bacteroidetes bacterium]|jgi:hypothetical protein|nr:hypothetical protein [Bacteroidota bacterium]
MIFLLTKSDKVEILKFIFAETDLRIFDLSSEYGQKVSEYNSLEEITNKFDLVNGDKFACTFHLWSSLFDGEVIFNRVDLNPKSCNGHTFRYDTNGWGLIQLFFGGLRNNLLYNSHIGHFNKAGAFAREGIPKFMGRADQWNWKEIEKASRKLKSQIQKLSITKIGAFDILPGAQDLINAGVDSWPKLSKD